MAVDAALSRAAGATSGVSFQLAMARSTASWKLTPRTILERSFRPTGTGIGKRAIRFGSSGEAAELLDNGL